MTSTSSNCGDNLTAARDTLWRLIEDGLNHGFFHFEVNSEIIKDEKRRLVIHAGKSHIFFIPDDELPPRDS